MIRIGGHTITSQELLAAGVHNSMHSKIARIMLESSLIYYFDSVEQLLFELRLRAEIIASSVELHRSGFSFEVFRKSYCNDELWDRTQEGGFRLAQGTSAFDATRDIYKNGHLYATECATAIIIVYYGALSRIFTKEGYDRAFSDIYLMNWKSVDRSLNVRTFSNVKEGLPGDCRYFKNPDVDPVTPEWQGENAIDLGDGTYYGHGIGIANDRRIIEALNRHRKAEATQSAYLLDTATRPGFKQLFNIYKQL